MAVLDVQPKKTIPALPLILVLAGLLVLMWFLTRKRDTGKIANLSSDSTVNTMLPAEPPADHTRVDWSQVNFNAPGLQYDEIKNKNVFVRGIGNYGIYGINETILFDQGQSTIRRDAEGTLAEVASSIGSRYNDGMIRVYGYTDAEGSTGANNSLALARAEAVKVWFQNNGMDAGRISVNAIGEANAIASNNTAKGRQQNRRVEIVAWVTDTTGKAGNQHTIK